MTDPGHLHNSASSSSSCLTSFHTIEKAGLASNVGYALADRRETGRAGGQRDIYYSYEGRGGDSEEQVIVNIDDGKIHEEDGNGDDTDPLLLPTTQASQKSAAAHHFVPAWEGLRGVAVMAVCLCHFQNGPQPLDALLAIGGVGTFFVLSGYLITGVLLRLQATCGTRSTTMTVHYRHLYRFYLDRSVRLYPALVFMLVASTVMGLMVIPSMMSRESAKHIVLALTYLTDFASPKVPPGVLWQNTWSLAVEEQFYIFWSLLLPLLVSLRKSLQLSIVGLLFLTSSSLMYLNKTMDGQDGWVHLLIGVDKPLPNFSKMFFGALLQLSNPVLPTWTKRPIVCWLGIALFGLYALSLAPPSRAPIDLSTVLDLSSVYFGWKACMDPIVCICAGLIIVGSENSGNWLLEMRALRWMGKISYSLYLWQVPLNWIHYHRSGFVMGLHAVELTSFAILLAMFSTEWIEEPVQKWYRRGRRAGGLERL